MVRKIISGHFSILKHIHTRTYIQLRKILKYFMIYDYRKDTKTLVSNFEMPKINSKIISTEVCLLITIDAYTVYMIGVRISKYSPW